MLTDFFWEQMLDEVIEELATSQPVSEYCSEYDANYVKDSFEPRNLEITADRNVSIFDYRMANVFVKVYLDVCVNSSSLLYFYS